ncbi:Clp protease N-terminal domain-containing protein [Mycobacterium timonense]|uniref:Clp protease N-terminal domain-containing protein n=1 Tax=Mycobacterium bouchedurhonense TaxID=701041 RepID=A0AAW5S4P8_MYCBC|nr:Clp protease N-terminal domain-containing protein [Mycobacterium bouchedurhonense]MCV6995810.1 Clp protease N-terminal domain-containing protein [Mycobacterium timonense]
MERTRDETEARGRHSVEPSHVLAALMLDGQSAAAKTIRSLGIQPVAVRDRLLSRD